MSRPARRPLPPPPGSSSPTGSFPTRKITDLPPQPFHEDSPSLVPRANYPARPLPPRPPQEHEQAIYDDGEQAPNPDLDQVYDDGGEAGGNSTAFSQLIYEDAEAAPAQVPRGNVRPLPPNPSFDQQIYDEGEAAPPPIPQGRKPPPPSPGYNQQIYDEGEAAPPPIPQGRKPPPPSPGYNQDFGPDENYDEFEIASTQGQAKISTYDEENDIEENPYELGDETTSEPVRAPPRSYVKSPPIAPIINRSPAILPHAPEQQDFYTDPNEEPSPPALPRHVTQISQLPASQRPAPQARKHPPIPPTPPTPPTRVHQDTYEEVPDFDNPEGEEDYEDFEHMDLEPQQLPPLPKAPQGRPNRPLPSIESTQDDNSGSSDGSGGHMPPKVNKIQPPPLGFDLSQILKVKLKATNTPPKTNKKAETDEYNHILSARARLKNSSENSGNVVPLKPPNKALIKPSVISPPPAISPPELFKRPPKLPTADSSENVKPAPKVQVSPPVPVVPKPPYKIPSAIVSPMVAVKIRPDLPLPPPPVSEPAVKIGPEVPLPPPPVSEPHTQNNNNNNEEQDQLMVYPWFHGNITRPETEKRLLEVGGDGVYLVRNSKKGSADQPYTLTILYQNNFFTLKVRCREKDKKIALGEEKTGEMTFSSVASLISYHKDHNVILIGNPGGKTTLLSYPPSE